MKKVNKWTCKLCGEKQSLKTVIFQGSGKECRLEVQKLNGLKASAEQNHFNGIDGGDRSSDDGGLPVETLTATQTNWSDFLVDRNEDAEYDEILFNLPSIENTPIQETCNKQENKPSEDQLKCTEMSDLASSNDCIAPKRNCDCSSENDVLVVKVRKIDTNTSMQSEWDQYLEDESSDD